MDKFPSGAGAPTRAIDAPASLAPDLAGLEPVQTLKRRWPAYLGAVLTVVMVLLLARQLFSTGLAGLEQTLPDSPWFYVFFLLLYFSPVTGDYIIFRKLWGIPAEGFGALAKKRIANDMLNYSGEAYFYTWARQRTSLVAAPFGAVKDVSILSAIAGNAFTFGLTVVALSLYLGLLTPHQQSIAIWSTVIVFFMSVPFLVFSKRVFSLDRNTLWWIFGVHFVRLVAGSVLIALTWHFGMPSESVGMWLLLAALRMIVSRLPLVPNKDLFFALSTPLIGQSDEVRNLIALTAGLTLVVHVVLIAGFSLWGLLRKKHAVS
ncbi:hypothetical protein BH10PSE15_BH10PSE15_08340 [soil metagenome]